MTKVAVLFMPGLVEGLFWDILCMWTKWKDDKMKENMLVFHIQKSNQNYIFSPLKQHINELYNILKYL